MRPQRKAAIAAKAAIETVSKELEDEPEDLVPHSKANAAQDTEAAYDPAQSTLLDFKREKKGNGARASSSKRGKKAQDDSLEESITVDESLVVIENPSLLDKLPAELRRDIISYFDTDPYTILSLMQVNKHFHSTLTKGERADADWKRRCLAMGSKHRSPGCKTWQETYYKIMKKKCAVCCVNTTAKLGLLFEKGPRWLVVCEWCQTQEPGPYKVITRDWAIAKYGLTKEILKGLECKYRKVNDDYWVTDFLLSTVIRVAEALREETETEDDEEEEEEG